VGSGDLGGRGRPGFEEREVVAGVGRRDPPARRYRRHAVSWHHGHQRRPARAWGEQPREARERGVIGAEDAAQQRSPGEVDGERSGDPEQRLRRVLGGRDREQRVRQRAALRRSPRRPRHALGAGVHADHERVRPRARGGEHVPAVAGAEVDHDARVARRQALESADVELVECATANDAKHAVIVGPLEIGSAEVCNAPDMSGTNQRVPQYRTQLRR
jgi:hypothetical protein